MEIHAQNFQTWGFWPLIDINSAKSTGLKGLLGHGNFALYTYSWFIHLSYRLYALALKLSEDMLKSVPMAIFI